MTYIVHITLVVIVMFTGAPPPLLPLTEEKKVRLGGRWGMALTTIVSKVKMMFE